MSKPELEVLVKTIYEERICDQLDLVLPVVGDEGAGKSTLILQAMKFWQEVRGREIDHDRLLDNIAYTREDFEEMLAARERRSVIAVPDAGRVLHKKESMKGEQVEIQKDFNDVRTKEFLILLGFQWWDFVPKFLQNRRAKAAIYVPHRGRFQFYNRDSLDKRVKMEEEWPDADFSARFPALDGTDLWDRYQELDRKKKDERLGPGGDEEEEEELTAQDVVDEIKSEGKIRDYVRHLNNGSTIVESKLIKFDYDELSKGEAETVKTVLERDFDIERLGQDTQAEVVADGGRGEAP